MPPRIRSFFSRPPYAREAQAKTQKSEAPRVFREFVETLQRLDAVRTPVKHASAPRTARKRRYVGNGHKRPPTRRPRSHS